MNATDTILGLFLAFVALLMFGGKKREAGASAPTPETLAAPTPIATPEVPSSSTPTATPETRRYTISYGTPVPTNNFCREGIRLRNNSTRLYRDEFPYQILPSGGASCILSESEMFAVLVTWLPQPDEVDTTTHIYFYRLARDGYGEKQIYHLEGPDFSEEPQGFTYGAFIGRYDWELQKEGLYEARIKTKFGEDKIQFEVL